MTATRPAAAPLEGRIVRLEPFDPARHLDGLVDALARPEVFAGGYGGGPAGLPDDEAGRRRFFSSYGVAPDAVRFVALLRSGPSAGAVVGASTLGDLDEAGEKAHIGWTAWHPAVWGTAVNPEAKLLMLGLAFDSGYGRVKLQGDSQNERSRAAILRLGATFEGVLRRDRQRADGTWSGTAVYSILVDEWPSVRSGLEQRIADWGEREIGTPSDPSTTRSTRVGPDRSAPGSD